MKKKLYRTKHDRKLAGICGGAARYLKMDPTIIRLLFLVSVLMTGVFPMMIGYVLAIFVIPNEEEVME